MLLPPFDWMRLPFDSGSRLRMCEKILSRRTHQRSFSLRPFSTANLSTVVSSAIACVTLCLAAAAFADEPAQAASHLAVDSIWINAGLLSRHFDRSQNFEEHNHGFGVELGLADGNALVAGRFVNSVHEHSNYVGGAWRPWVLGPARIGAVVGLFDGYPKANNGGWFPGVLPVASFDWKYAGFNFLLVPKISDKVYGAAVVQFKLRLK